MTNSELKDYLQAMGLLIDRRIEPGREPIVKQAVEMFKLTGDLFKLMETLNFNCI